MPLKKRRWHFGVLPFTGTGHLNPLLSLSQELVDRGHRVTFFEKPKIEERVLQAGFDFFPIGTNGVSQKTTFPTIHRGVWSDVSILRFNLQRIIQDLQSFLEETPPALTEAGVDALIVNEIALTGPTVAQMLRLPYFIISTSVPHNCGWGGFPLLSGYRWSRSWFSRVQSAYLELSVLSMRGPILRALNGYRRRAGLGPVREIPQTFPHLVQITQMPQCLELPREVPLSGLFYAGPFLSKKVRPAVDFPWNRLDGRAVVYASLGTTRNVQHRLFHLIAEACDGLDVQLVISTGGRFAPETLDDLPGDPIVAKYVPQLQLLKIAKIVITHGGANTVFETLLEGLPMVAIPIAHDQPAIAARLARLKVAEVLPVMRLSAMTIRNALVKLLTNPAYRNAAVALQARMRATQGAERAAEVMEEALDRHSAAVPKGLFGTLAGLPPSHSPSRTTKSSAPR